MSFKFQTIKKLLNALMQVEKRTKKDEEENQTVAMLGTKKEEKKCRNVVTVREFVFVDRRAAHM